MKNVNPDHPLDPPANATTLAEIVRDRAAAHGDEIAYSFLADGLADARSLTWAQLHLRANALASSLKDRGGCGQTVVLALPSGLAFIEALFGVWYAGAIALPVSLPRHQRVKHRLHQIITDAGARFAVGTEATRQQLESQAIERLSGSLTWIDSDAPAKSPPADNFHPGVKSRDVALLQYTSGSTGSPRGVVVTHENLVCNSALIAEACGHRRGQTIAGWLPLFHDMGLVGLVLQAAFSGARCVFMSPERFLMRPNLWLQMISDYAACSSPAPNFAYDLCAEKVTQEQKAKLNLSGWRNALNGSEPVRAATLDRFSSAFVSCGFNPRAFFPCYGLAEATLFVTGPDENRRLTRRTTDGRLMNSHEVGGHVACGRTFGDTQLTIVDPRTSRRVSPGTIGEIWVAGGSVAREYWNNPQASADTFGAKLNDVKDDSNNALRWLGTGDLGFIADGELFITGRLRELIKIAGRNHFPVDLERTVESADPAIATGGAGAFSADIDGIERLFVVAEVRREYVKPARTACPRDFDPDAIRRRVRAAVANEHEVAVHDVILLHPGGLPRTTSGKISRQSTRDGYLNNTLERLELAVV